MSEAQDAPQFEIVGGAGPQETAAIMAVVAHLTAEEAAARATPSQRPRQSAWVLAWRPRPSAPPMPSHTYDATPWSEIEASEEPG